MVSKIRSNEQLDFTSLRMYNDTVIMILNLYLGFGTKSSISLVWFDTKQSMHG